jgi:hypothetical protein
MKSISKPSILIWLLFVGLSSACVDQIEFEIPPAESQMIVEGSITDAPGPYTVKVSRGINLNDFSFEREPISQLKIVLYDDLGNSENFSEEESGIYKTAGRMQGTVGRSYHISIETPDGKMFESLPDELHNVGEVEDITFEFESRVEVRNNINVQADAFNIFIDADGGTRNENYVRWRMTGTYKAVTFPELFMRQLWPHLPYKDPFPCSGYVLIYGNGNGGTLDKRSECTCCECWARQYESVPQLSDAQLVSGNQFRNIKVGEAPVTMATFHDKYLIEVEQMSLTRNAFDFLRLVRSQKESASSLFQPPSGEIRGNIIHINNKDAVVGLFWATSITKKSIFIQRTDIPYPLVPNEIVTRPCADVYPNATYEKPTTWE